MERLLVLTPAPRKSIAVLSGGHRGHVTAQMELVAFHNSSSGRQEQTKIADRQLCHLGCLSAETTLGGILRALQIQRQV